MIRNNKNIPTQTQHFCSTQMINYRNAIFQGEYNKQREQRSGNGIIYVSNSHHFIACTKFQANLLSGNCFFFHEHYKYSYGHWNKNKIHGFAVFRMYQILIITEYDQGILTKGTNILVVFQKYNTALLLEIVNDENWQMIQKHEINSSDQLQDLIKQCKFHQNQQICHSLIKFLNSKMISDSCFLKLRLISNKFYRYGFDKGLAIVFDDQFKILSNGIHNQTMLCDLGIKYNYQQLDNILQQGVFDGRNTFTFNSQNRPFQKIEKAYRRYHLSAINFKNEFFIDPSEPYFKYFQNMLQSPFMKDIFTNAIINKSAEYDSYQKIMFQQKNKDQFPNQYQQWKQIPPFKKKDDNRSYRQKQSLKSHRKQQGLDIIKMNMNKNMEGMLKDSRQFSKLPQKNRLEILKQELYQNINQKQFPINVGKEKNKREIDSTPRQKLKIIHMEPVNARNINKDKEKENILIRQSREKQRDQIIPQVSASNHNFELLKSVALKQESASSKSRQRLKIFDLDKSIKRDYSPQTSLSPFKSRMRARIFNKTPERPQNTPEKNNKSNYSPIKSAFKQKQMKQFQQGNAKIQNKNKYFSPYYQLENSHENGNLNQIISQPMIISKKQQIKQKHSPAHFKINQEQYKKGKQRNSSQLPTKQNIKLRDDNLFKRDNKIYRNSLIKEQYGNYVYEPINIMPIKQSGNSPYISNGQNITKVKSFSQLKVVNDVQISNTNKKSIGNTSPLKMQKIKDYLNDQRNDFAKNNKKVQRSPNYKKRLNYF